jgi:hypothetical protein
MSSRRWQISHSVALVVLGAAFLSGCGFGTTRPDAVVHTTRGHIPINCGNEPRVDKVLMRPVKAPRIVTVNGAKWVAISLENYSNLSKNVADMVTSYEQRYAQVTWHRDCIADFNSRAQPQETP